MQNNNNSCLDFDIIIMGSEQRLGILVKSSIPAYRILGSVVHPGNIDSVVNSFLQEASFSEKSFDEEIERGFKPISSNKSKIIVTGFDCEKKTSSIIERSMLRRFLLVYTRMLGRDELNSRLIREKGPGEWGEKGSPIRGSGKTQKGKGAGKVPARKGR